MIVCIEQTTDSRSPQTKVQTMRSEAAARRWLAAGSDSFAFPGAARGDLPLTQQNWHRRIRTAYVMPPHWRLPSANRIAAERGSRPWEDRRSDKDIVASIVWREREAELRVEARAHG